MCPFLLRDQQNACRQNRQAAKCDDGFFFEADVSNVFNGLTIAGDDFAVRTLMPVTQFVFVCDAFAVRTLRTVYSVSFLCSAGRLCSWLPYACDPLADAENILFSSFCV